MPIRLDYPAASSSKLPDPPRYSRQTQRDVAKNVPVKGDASAIAIKAKRATELKMRRAWDLALSPAKSLPMQGIMLYFSGGVQIFSLGMIFTLLTGPITAIASVFRAFESLRPTPPTASSDQPVSRPSYLPLAGPMVLYIACQGLVFALGLWKCWSMGVLPTGKADWLQFETRLSPPEWSAIRSLSLG